MDKIEYRTVKFLTKLGKSVPTVLNEMSSAYGDSFPGKTNVYKWHSLFKQGRKSLEDDPRHRMQVTTPELTQKVEKIVLDDARLKRNNSQKLLEYQIQLFLKYCTIILA